jgi:EmrB/QacA subfamily drug resistance transporter
MCVIKLLRYLKKRFELSDYTPQEKSALFVATITSFTGPFVISSVNVALPAIQKEFNADAVQLSWIATALLLAVAVTLVPAGRIADIHGRKKIFTWGLSLYTLASLLAAFADSVEMLIFFRVFQGVGSAMFLTTGMAIITSIFPPKKRGKAIGIYVSAVYIGLSVGPFVGGLLTQNVGWRSLFIIVVPLGVISIVITLKYLKGEWADAKGEPLDVAGSFLYGIAILAWVYGASLLPSKTAMYLMLAGTLCMAVFVWQELRVRYPVVEVRLFSRNKLFTFSSLAAMIHYSATHALTFLISLYLQYIKGLSPQTAGMIIVAQPIMMATFSPLAGKWSDRIEPRKIASFGMALTALGLFLLAWIGKDTSLVYITSTLLILGFGFAMFSSPNMNAIMSSVEKRYLGIASGTVATMRLIGQMGSMAISMVMFAVIIGRVEIAPENYPQFIRCVNLSFSIFFVLCIVGVFFSLFRGELRGND